MKTQEVRNPWLADGRAVLVTAKLEHEAIALIRQGNAIAEAHDVPLRICHVLPELPLFDPLFPHLMVPMGYSEMESVACDSLRDLSFEALGKKALNIEILIEHGTPHSGLHRIIEKALPGLVVVGGSDHRHFLGGVAERVARHSNCAVLIVRAGKGSSVLAATDFSDPALPAVTVARVEAARRQRELFVLNCFDLLPVPPMSADFVAALPVDYTEGLRKSSLAKLATCAEKFGGKPLFVEGVAGTSILLAAKEINAELIVVGSHGRSGLHRLALGSITENVIRGAPCSVMVVPLAK